MQRSILRSVVVAASLLTPLSAPAVADACGLAFGKDVEPPFLSEERVLLIWNEQTRVEHFVREVRFEQANKTFGFIVPTPGKPEVAKVERSPFQDLERDAPYPIWSSGLGLGGFGLGGGGGGLGTGAGSGVEVAKVQRIGRFKAFTLAAQDPAALRRWLEDNGFQARPALDRWLAHYVDLGFHFVAFRYEAKKDEPPGMVSETVRLSFESELPYYPYFEPEPPQKQTMRRLTTWFVSQHGLRPIAAMTGGGKTELVNPWFSGNDPTPSVDSFAKTLGELGALLPIDKPELQVQVFQDHKIAREGFHDVLFVPLEPPAADAKLEPATEAKHRAMVRWLDPTVRPSASPGAPTSVAAAAPAPPGSPPSASPSPSSAPRTTAPTSCAYGSGGAPAAPALLALAWATLARRRRRLAAPAATALLLLVSCSKPAPSPAAVASSTPATAAAVAPASQASAAQTPEPADSLARERERALLAALQGILPARMATEAGPWDDRPNGLGIWQSPSKVTKTVTIAEKVAESGPGLPAAVVRRILRANFPRLRACYVQGLKKNPALAGTFEVKYEIGVHGEVAGVAPGKGTLADPSVQGCMVGVIKTLTFPDPDGGKVQCRHVYEFTNK